MTNDPYYVMGPNGLRPVTHAERAAMEAKDAKAKAQAAKEAEKQARKPADKE